MADDVSGHLVSADGELDQATTRSAAARIAIEEQRRRIGAWFPGVAKNLGTVLPRFDTIDGLLGTAKATIAEAIAEASKVPEGPTPDQVNQHLTPVLASSEQALATLNTTVGETGRAATQISQALSGGSPGTLVGHVNDIKSFVQAAYRKVKKSREAAEARMGDAGRSGRLTGGGAASPAPSSPSTAASIPESPSIGSPPPSASAAVPGYPTNAGRHISWSDLHHVIDGDPDNPKSGGHGHGLGRPGKTEFPAEWEPDDIRDALLAVAHTPESVVRRENNWRVEGTHRGSRIRVYVRDDGTVEAGHPLTRPRTSRAHDGR